VAKVDKNSGKKENKTGTCESRENSKSEKALDACFTNRKKKGRHTRKSELKETSPRKGGKPGGVGKAIKKIETATGYGTYRM